MSEIQTEFETKEEQLDRGVAKKVKATENYVAHGEKIERKTELQFLEDGGIAITQRIEDQNIFDSLTLGSDVVRCLLQEGKE